jgi:hypothetical protein
VVDDEIIGAHRGFKVRAFRKPIAHHEYGQFVIVRDAKEALKKFLAVREQTVLMRIEVRRVNTQG